MNDFDAPSGGSFLEEDEIKAIVQAWRDDAISRGYESPSFELDGSVEGYLVTGSNPPGLPQMIASFDQARLTMAYLEMVKSGGAGLSFDVEKGEILWKRTK